MSDHVYADTDALGSLQSVLRDRYNAVVEASNAFYASASACQWHDDLTERAMEHYEAVLKSAEQVLTLIDGSREVLSEQLEDLHDYFSVQIK